MSLNQSGKGETSNTLVSPRPSGEAVMEPEIFRNKSRSQIIKMINKEIPFPEEEEKTGNNKVHTRSEFKTVQTLGQGSYGKVYLVEYEKQQYALKELSKEFILKVSKI